MADSRLDKLEAVVREMRKRLEPQAMANSLERAWSPRGYADWTRVTDSSGGQASPPRRLLQFPGATITDDPTVGDRGATVVTISGGGGGAAYRFSDTYPSTAADERIEFVAESGAAVDHMIVDTGSIGTLRVGQIIVAENVASPDPSGSLQFLANASSGQATGALGAISGPASALASASSDGTTAVGSLSATNGAHVASLALASDGGASATSGLLQATEDGVDVTYVRVEPGTVAAHADPAAYGVEIFTATEESGFMQLGVGAAGGLGATLKRVTRGPFVNVVGVLGPLTSTTFTILDCRVGTDYVVQGAIKGVPSSEWVSWSYDDSGANDVTVSVTNMDPANNHTLTMVCNIVSTA